MYNTACPPFLPPSLPPSLYSKLINISVQNTVDLRALTVVSPTARPSQRAEANQENMTLVIESARAIGCKITDSTGEDILRKDPQTIRDFLVDLIRVSGSKQAVSQTDAAVHLPFNTHTHTCTRVPGRLVWCTCQIWMRSPLVPLSVSPPSSPNSTSPWKRRNQMKA